MVDVVHWLIIKWVLQTYLWHRYISTRFDVIGLKLRKLHIYMCVYIYTKKKKYIYWLCMFSRNVNNDVKINIAKEKPDN